MAHTIIVTDSVPGAAPRTYTAPTLPGLIREVLMCEFDIALIDLDLGPEEFPSEITNCWLFPSLDRLAMALDPFATLTHSEE